MGGLAGTFPVFAEVQTTEKLLYVLGLVALFAIPYFLSGVLARRYRVPEYRTRMGIILFSILAGIAVVAIARYPRFGVDLRGGVILVYRVDVEATSAGQTGADNSASGGTAATSRTKTDVNMADLVDALKRRLNPDGLKEIVIRPFGVNQVEIIIPQAEGAEIDAVKREIATAGVLLFRIVANTKDHQREIQEAERQLADPALRMLREVRDAQGRVVARWVPVARDVREQEGVRPLKVDVSGDIIRDGRTGQRITDIPRDAYNTEQRPVAFEKWLASRNIELVEVLMIEPRDSTLDVRGDFLGAVRSDYDESLRPCVRFTMKGVGASRMAALTSLYRPEKDPEFYRRLGIVLDNELLSAPRIMSTIAENGQITGRFTQEEVDSLVRILRAGKLPAVLHKEPISENQIGPMLGLQTIRQGSIAIAVSLISVLGFTLFYYRWAGMVACLALILNLLLTYALMIVLSASLTLPGLAGLVLTVGMSVDANVLIYERIREELQKGAALRMAIRNGFSRALNTIVDANVTTLITGMILYVIGTDQVRGFAVTLCLGILMCMYTGVYCARLLFEMGERNRWITRLKMLDWVGTPSFGFMSKARLCITLSLVLIVVGLIAVIERNKRLLDKDIAGGVSVVMYLKEPMKDADVRRKLDDALAKLRREGTRIEYTLNHMTVADRPEGTIWKVDSSFNDVDSLKQLLAETFDLVTYSMEFDPVQAIEAAEPSAPQQSPAQAPATTSGPPSNASPTGSDAKSPEPSGGATQPSNQPQPTSPTAPQQEQPPKEDTTSSKTPETPAPDSGDNKPSQQSPPKTSSTEESSTEESFAEDPTILDSTIQHFTTSNSTTLHSDTQDSTTQDSTTQDSTTQDSTTQDSPKQEAATQDSATKDASAKDAAAQETTTEPASSPTASPSRRTIGGRSVIKFQNAVERDTLKELIEKAANELHEGFVAVTLTPMEIDATGRQASRTWQVELNLPPEEVTKVLHRVQDQINHIPVWIQASAIGSQVASGTRNQAIAAAVASLIGIIGYLWVRFQRVAYGIAAVVALIHDVLITIGLLALSHYIAPFSSFLLLEEFKINLPVVAALMTLIGYSLNDTIVVFDRIREVRGRSPQLTPDMIDKSVNQTLSRTLLTAGTTLLVIVILYAIGGEGIHGFSFTLLVGLIVGTYSSVFIASPVLLYLVNRAKTKSSLPSV